MSWEEIWQKVSGWLTDTGIKIVISLIVIFISFKIINIVAKKIRNKSKKLDKTVSHSLINFCKTALKLLVVVCIITYLGIDTSAITALITSLGVCVGLAVNGTLSNLAGGIMIVITHPFKEDDYISALDLEGTVEDVSIIYTRIRTPDNKTVYLPNGSLSTTTIVNYNQKGLRRLDLTYSISYDQDFAKPQSVILGIIDKHEKILKDPAPLVRILSHSASSIDICVKAWVKSEDYWDTYFDMNELVKKNFDAENITIPYNQLDVHVKND